MPHSHTHTHRDTRIRWRTALLPLCVFVIVTFGASLFSTTAIAADAAPLTAHVVSVSDPADEVGQQILAAGGNAVDAAVATALALAVTWPEAGNLAGGGFMMIAPPGQDPVCVEYRETAPAAVQANTLANDRDSYTGRMVGVPGTVRGLALAHARFGRLDWPQLIAPAIRLAAEGFVVDTALAESLNGVLRGSNPQRFQELHRVFRAPRESSNSAPKNSTAGNWQAGDVLKQPDLAKTLQGLSDGGPDAFYSGEIAQSIVDEVRLASPDGRAGGFMELADLTTYQAHVRPPVQGTFRGYEILGPPPPSSGGICLVQMLNVLENFDLQAWGRWEPRTLHVVIETMRRAYRDRARWLGDADFVDIPAELTSKNYARDLARSIDPHRATPSTEILGDMLLTDQNRHTESPSTTHFSILDADGMAVANTYTLEQSYGSRIVVRNRGFLLNNEMGDFNRRPGITNRSGVIGTAANELAPGKRMLSSQTPCIVRKDGKTVLITGSPGGRTIINTVLWVVLNRLEFGASPEDSVALPRCHQPWFPDRVYFENPSRLAKLDPAASVPGDSFAAALAQLKALGHNVQLPSFEQGDAHSIFIEPSTGQVYPVHDGRRRAP